MDRFSEPDNGQHGDKEKTGEITAGGAAVHSKLPLWFIKSRNTIYYALSVIEVLLLLRFLFLLLGASRESGFISFLYGFTGIFTAPFEGIFHEYATRGLAAKAVFDPAVPIAMIVYALIALGLVKLLWVKISRDGF
jgi:hypothetical protein